MSATQGITRSSPQLDYIWTIPAARSEFLALHQSYPGRYPHLLESAAHGTPQGRYDILFAFPQTRLTLAADGSLYRDSHRLGQGGFLEALDAEWRQQACKPTVLSRRDQSEPFLPFTGGWFVFLSYELAREVEDAVGSFPYAPEMPLACATRFPAAFVRDRVHNAVYLVCEASYERELLPIMLADVASGVGLVDKPDTSATVFEEDPRRFLENVRRIREYIRAGDVFQVNLSRMWTCELSGDVCSSELYRRLRAANPAPFAALVTFGAEQAIISSSPERLVRVTGRSVVTRPIAGTYPRSTNRTLDEAWARELLLHPKERAEHIMLIDLERNDLGRISRTGTVRVSELMARESYRHVHHIVSEITGELPPQVTPGQVIHAVFPGGTITGCPKVRCMEIIAELEQAPRGAYTGAVGYINHDGTLDLNILIRTLVRNRRDLSLRAGAGIVADSIPERELEETRMKAKGLVTSLEVR